MKRSEFINEIVDKKMKGDEDFWYAIQDAVEYADRDTIGSLFSFVLKEFEEAGMLPPQTIAEPIQRGFVDNTEVIEEYCVWENEDEEK